MAQAATKAVTYRATLPDGSEVTTKSHLRIDGQAYLGVWRYHDQWKPGSITGKVLEAGDKLCPIYGYGNKPAEGQVAVEAFPIG